MNYLVRMAHEEAIEGAPVIPTERILPRDAKYLCPQRTRLGFIVSLFIAMEKKVELHARSINIPIKIHGHGLHATPVKAGHHLENPEGLRHRKPPSSS